MLNILHNTESTWCRLLFPFLWEAEAETQLSPFNNLSLGIFGACVAIPHSNITVIYGFVYSWSP